MQSPSLIITLQDLQETARVVSEYNLSVICNPSVRKIIQRQDTDSAERNSQQFIKYLWNRSISLLRL